MNHLTANIGEDPNIGLYGWATDRYCLLGKRASFERTLKVKVRTARVFTIELAGLFLNGNSSGIMVPATIEDDERAELEKTAEVLCIDTNMTCMGNMAVMNDKGIIISSLIKKHKPAIERFFGLPVVISTIAKSKVIGSSAIASNKGCICHPKLTEKEEDVIRKVLDVDAMRGTVSFGSPFVKAGLIANSHGFVASTQTSGYELGAITEALGFL